MSIKDRISFLKSIFTGKPPSMPSIQEVVNKINSAVAEGDFASVYEGIETLRKVFGYRKLPVDDEFLSSYVELLGQTTYSWYHGLLHKSMDRMARYLDYEMMDDYSDIASALDIYAEDSTVFDRTRSCTVWVESANKKIEDIASDLFTRLNLENRIFGMARAVAKYGDLFDRLLFSVDNKRIEAVEYIDPKFIVRIVDGHHRLKGFRIGLSAGTASGKEKGDSQPPLEPWDVVHYRVPGRSLILDYGDSLLSAARPIWVQLKLMEDALVLYRLHRAADRLIYYIDVGNVGSDEAWRIVQQWKKTMKRKQFLDPDTGKFDSRYNPLCLTGDTKIPLLSGVEKFIKDIEPGDEVYSTDGVRIKVGKVVAKMLTGIKAKVVKVTLDNGESFKCTPDHLLMLRDGSYRPAIECEGLSLMPLYRRISSKENGDWLEGYEILLHPDGVEQYTHRMVADCVYGRPRDAKGRFTKDCIVNHKNFNKLDNSSKNLEWISYQAYAKFHSKHAIETWFSPKTREKWRKACEEKVWGNPKWLDFVRKNGAMQLTKFNKENASRLITEYNKSDEHRSRISVLAKNGKIGFGLLWKSDEYRKKMRLIQSLNGHMHVEKYNKSEKSRFIGKLMFILRSEYKQFLKKLGRSVTEIPYADWYLLMYNASYKNHPKYVEMKNHKVVKVEPAGYEDVYDIIVEKYHNFALSAGVFVHNSSIDDLYWPVRPGSSSKIDKLPGSANVSDIADVEYFRDKLYSALKIPKAYFSSEAAGWDIFGRGLAQQDVRYSHTVKRLQRAMIAGLRRLVDIELACKGMDPRQEENEYDLMMTVVSNIEDKQFVETILEKLDSAAKLIEIGNTLQLDMSQWRDYVLRDVVGIPGDVLQKVLSQPWMAKELTPIEPEVASKAAPVISELLKQDPEWADIFENLKQGLKLLIEAKGIKEVSIPNEPLPIETK